MHYRIKEDILLVRRNVNTNLARPREIRYDEDLFKLLFFAFCSRDGLLAISYLWLVFMLILLTEDEREIYTSLELESD